MTNATTMNKAVIADVSNRSLSELLSLKDRVAVVTGGTAGIGLATCKRLIEAGACVLVAGHKEASARQAAAQLTTDLGGRVLGVEVEASDSASLSALADRAVAEFGRLDVWVNNAGIYPAKPALDMSDDDWRQVIDLDLSGVFFACREAAKRMIAAGNGGVIINLSSVAGFIASPKQVSYTSAKHGIGGLTKSMAVELGPYGIRVLAVAPTLIKTPGTDSVKFRDSTGLNDEQMAQMLPLGRVGVPDDIARVVLLCASDLTVYMTGNTLLVDAGQMAGM